MTVVIDPPRLDNSPPVDMPPFDTVKCTCSDSCPMSGPCEMDATDDDLLCDLCRKFADMKETIKAGVFSRSMIDTIRYMRKAQRSMAHCHACDPGFDKDGDDNASS